MNSKSHLLRFDWLFQTFWHWRELLSCCTEPEHAILTRIFESSGPRGPFVWADGRIAYTYIYYNSFFYIYLLWRVGCLPLIISISPSLNRCPSPGSRREWVCERGGALKTSSFRCDEAHLKWMEPHHRRCYMPSAPLLGRPVSSPCMHAGVLVGPGRERWGSKCRTRDTADGPGCRAV